MPGIPLGICVKCVRCRAAFAVVSNGQWSVPTVSIRPARSASHSTGRLRPVAQRRRHDVLHAFHAGPLGIGLVEQEMRQHRFDVQADAAQAGFRRGTQRGGAGEMHDIARRAGLLHERRKAAGAFGLDRLRPARLVPLRPGLACGQKPLLQLAHQFGILAMRGGDDAQLGGQIERVEQLFVRDAKKILVGEENLERRRAVADDLAELRLQVASSQRDTAM